MESGIIYALFSGKDGLHVIKADHKEYENYLKEYGEPIEEGSYNHVINKILMQD